MVEANGQYIRSAPAASTLYQIPLLAPKLRPPRPHASLISREHSLALLDASLEHKLTLLAAPAGFGKTTLVSTWIAMRGTTIPLVAWVALDAGDNDPIRFWHYIIAACQTFQEDLGSTALMMLRAAQQPPFQRHSLEGMLTALLNELTLLPGRGILVLEDYHLITAPEIHEAMSYFIEHLPASLHLVLIARNEPPLPLARLRAHGDLSELGASHLRFNREETRAFLRQTLPFPLESVTIDHLQTRTEGWVTGLRLITLALQGQEHTHEQEIEQMLATIGGSQRHILEYLVADVLSAQPEPLQAFLLQTTGLNRLTGSLCDALTGRNDGASMLQQVERANLFLIPLDGANQWYRYHALFAEAIQHEARCRLGEDVLRSLASKASRWYEQHAMFNDAVDTALAAGETDRVAGLITRNIEAQGFQRITEFHTLLRWIAQLPEEILQHYPTLCQIYAMGLLFEAGQRMERHTPDLRERLEGYLQMAENNLRASGNLPRLGEVLALRALIAGQWQDFAAFHAARQALALLPISETFWRGTSLIIRGTEDLFAGRFNEAQPPLQTARTLMEADGNGYGLRPTLNALGMIYIGQGKLQQAAELYRQVLATAEKDPFDQGCALVGLATLSYEWNQLAAAERDAREAYTLGKDLGNELLLVPATTILARVLHALGQTRQAQELQQNLIAHLKQQWWYREIAVWQAWFAFTSGDLTTAQYWLSTCPAAPLEETLSEAQQEREALLTIRLLIVQGKVQEALDLLEHWRVRARSHTRTRSELEILVLTARAHFSEQDMQNAKQALKEALALARPAGYQRLFLDEGEDMLVLLRAILPDVQEQPMAAYIRGLLRAFAHRQGDISSTPPLVELLSLQERRVLRLLVAGRTNPEIARELVVSLNTVKTQVRSIYRKLNVSSRIEACEVARHLHLL